MSSPEIPTPKVSRGWFRKILRGLLMLLSGFVSFLFIAWATLAIYHSNLPWLGLRVALASVFLIFGVWSLWRPYRLRRIGMFAVAYLGLLVWWGTIKPSHDRNWRSDVTVMPRATIDGDKVKICGFRNFEYRSLEDFTVRHEDREFYHLLSNSCTINIVRYANKVGRVGRLDINHLLNGFIDRYLYSSGMIETNLPFEEFRRLSHINEPARKAEGSPDFAQRIRQAIRIPKY